MRDGANCVTRKMTAPAVFPVAALALLVTALLPATQSPPGYKPGTGPFRVESVRYDWQDSRRNRAVPVKIYFPVASEARHPVIAFSHGLGGTRESYEYLGRHWASHGYVSVHVQHAGSDDAVWRGQPQPLAAMRRAVANPANVLARPLDVSFALDRLAALDAESGPLGGRLDLERVGAAGHSFGAHTAMALAGLRFVLPAGERTLHDSRVRAAVVLSPPVPRDRTQLTRIYGGIAIPCLFMTGTLDESIVTPDTQAADRRLPFEHAPGPDKFLVVFDGGDHMVFSGESLSRLPRPRPELDPVFHDLIRQATIAFWDFYLKGEAAAGEWLAGDGFRTVLGAQGEFRKK